MRKKNSRWPVSVTTSALLLAGCATNSVPQPLRSVQLTPLPASVTEIDSQASEPWQEKASNWLQRVKAFSESAPPK